MRSSRSKRTALAIALLAATAVAALSAHRRDEYLQAARLAIEPDRVELQLDLTPGIALADRVIAAIDRDRDGVVSDAETRAYASAVQQDLALDLDGHGLPLALRDSRGATAESMSRGEGTLQLRWQAALPPLAGGTHRLTFRNRHHNEISVYLANVLVPASDRVGVTAQDRDVDQRELTVDYELRPEPAWRLQPLPIAVLAGALSGVAVLWRRRRLTRRIS